MGLYLQSEVYFAMYRVRFRVCKRRFFVSLAHLPRIGLSEEKRASFVIKYTLANGDTIDFKLKQTDFPNIKQRYNNFSKNNLLTLTYTDAIVDFNASLIGYKTFYIVLSISKNVCYNPYCWLGGQNIR